MTTIRDLARGSLFLERLEDGDIVLAVKSEYALRPEDPDSPAMCVIVGSGEYYCGQRGDDTAVELVDSRKLPRLLSDTTMLLRHALVNIVELSFRWDDGAPGDVHLERARWQRLRRIALYALGGTE